MKTQLMNPSTQRATWAAGPSTRTLSMAIIEIQFLCISEFVVVMKHQFTSGSGKGRTVTFQLYYQSKSWVVLERGISRHGGKFTPLPTSKISNGK